MSTIRPAIAVAVAVLALLIPAAVSAKRPATTHERFTIVHALGEHGSYALPPRCAKVYISTINSAWASQAFVYTRSCTRYDANGIAILHVEHHRWRIVTEGSSFRCPIISRRGQPSIPARVAADLLNVSCA